MTEPSQEHSLLDWLARPRIAPYLHMCGGDRVAATELYLWNSEICAALWEVIGHVECAVRRVVDHAMSERAKALDYQDEWYYHEELGDKLAEQVEEAGERAREFADRGKYELTADHVIARLGFGFWRYLFTRRMEGDFGYTLRKAFPSHPRTLRRNDLQLIGDRLSRLNSARNRIAHHEPIWWQPVDFRYDDALRVLGFISPDLRATVEANNRFMEVYAKRPKTACNGKRPSVPEH